MDNVSKSPNSEVTQEIIDNEMLMLERIIKNRKDKNTIYKILNE